jgi:methyltransferase (TIGR00027 family)
MHGLSATAYWVAAVRAIETRRPDALFRDPWAAALAGEEATRWAESRPLESLVPMVVRTRFFDDFLQRATFGEGKAQVVLLATGLDTRAFRLDRPAGTGVFEVDRAEVLTYKQAALTGVHPSCELQVYVHADLREANWPDQLCDAGFDPSCPAVWLAEGLLFYIPEQAIGDLLERVSSLASRGGTLGFDVPNRGVLSHNECRTGSVMSKSACLCRPNRRAAARLRLRRWTPWTKPPPPTMPNM